MKHRANLPLTAPLTPLQVLLEPYRGGDMLRTRNWGTGWALRFALRRAALQRLQARYGIQ